ncbi:phospholipase D p2 [Staphylotrichum tortipilum]|uniref:Phospholipase D p2 n=1 Tax=Staphylotrichum tortipilum TaxID=2831512 RepID=A0AAN6MKA0_9PEZI|nr:phospholipase D p2 [Staphylotrichum longicolle]
MSHPQSFVTEFLRRLEVSHPTAPHPPHRDFPSYNLHDSSERELVVTLSRPRSFQLGTGASIFTDCLIPAIISARHEVIFVTCFWAPSKTLTAVSEALTKLATHRRAAIQDARSRGDASSPPSLRVRICLSSISLLQKLRHPQSRSGYVYPRESWPKKLGLPDAALLEAGRIELRVKSLFFLPFSVMHPKFVIIDRHRAFLPSCNVSWEAWLEGCVEIEGDAVRSLLFFYSRTWEQPVAHDPEPRFGDGGDGGGDRIAEEPFFDVRQAGLALVPSTAHHHASLPEQPTLPTLVLPSSCHRNPRFHPFPWQRPPAPPRTPLNMALLQLLEHARRSIFIQTPNLTSEPVIAALLDALARGVDVVVVTNRNMMLLEQLVTAGTTTAWCIRSLLSRFGRLQEHPDRDPEAGRRGPGRLKISYFRPRCRAGSGTRESRPLIASPDGEEPMHSHLKLTLVDAEYAVLGSSNADRASWYTSQELGILFQGHEFCNTIKAGVDSVLEGRLELVFDSNDERRG